MKLLKFEASWCGPCKAMDHAFGMINLDVDIERINIDFNKELCDQYEVRSVPTLIMINDKGEELRRTMGMKNTDELMEFVKG